MQSNKRLSHVLSAWVPRNVSLFDLIIKEQINKTLSPENFKLCTLNKFIQLVAR